MSWPRITTVSVAANVALFGVVIFAFWSKNHRPAIEPRALPPTIITNTVTQIAVRKVNASNFWAALTASRNPNWALLESTNYTTYIENLKAVGCPEETIRDIIIADIAKLYAKKRAALRAEHKSPPFWKSEENFSPDKLLQRQQMQALDLEERALVKQLLGVDLQTEVAKFLGGVDSEETDYSYLPAEKRQRLLELQQQFEEAEQAVYFNARGLVLDEDQEQLKRLEKQKEEEMAKILSPEELEEYQLRTSGSASSLRSQLVGFDVNEQEFRQLFRLQKTFDEQFNNAFDTADEKQMETRAKAQEEAQRALDEEMKKVLGDKRFSEYQRSQDSDYRTLLQLSERFQVSTDLAAKVYEMKQEAERQKQAVEANANLAPERREAVLGALARETKNAISQAMGGNNSKLWKSYEKAGAQWLGNLSNTEVVVPVPSPAPSGDVAPMAPNLPFPPFPPFPPMPPFPR